ncbi:MAG: serine/threonine protein kinase [Planctomycetes bacterium]|nr:serine/threonine protein kinase [Planctomycetota bacterium]
MSVPQDALLGSVLGNCRIETRLAAGGMGVVYRAQSKRLDREVAMKVLAPSLAMDPEYVERFFREARAAGSIDHPNVVKVFDAGVDQERYYMVMEYVRGRTLADLIGEKGRLNLDQATRLVRDVARGLEAAHKGGLVHRDIKPANILLTHDQVPKITDFGLVRTGTRASGITIEGTFMGTPEYVSPEQAEGRKIDARCDLYSLGVTYYQMLSGSYPFYGKTAMEMALSRLREDPRPIEDALPGVDPRAAAVIRKLLRRSPNERYGSATDLIRDLEAILTGKPPTTVTPPRKNTRRLSVLSLDSKRVIRLSFFALLYSASFAAFGALGLAMGGRVRAEGDYWRGIAAAFRALSFQPGLREALLASGLIACAGSFFVFRRELSACGRGAKVGTLLILALAGVFAGTSGLGADTARGAESVARHLGWALTRPVQAGLASLALVVLSVGLSWSKPPGEYRYVVFRLMLCGAAFFLLVFATGRDLAGPFRSFRDSMGTLLPMGTVAVVVLMFGIELSVGHRWTGLRRGMGLFLLVAGLAGVAAFGAAGLHDLENRVDWVRILSGPLREAGRGFRRHAAPVGIAAVLLCLAWVLYLAGLAKGVRKTPTR